MIDRTVLVIDDDETLRKGLVRRLSSVVKTVLSASNGKEGLEVILSTPSIGAILSDIEMPEMNGLELIRELRHKGISTPFIFYTGLGTEDSLKEASKYGAFDFLHKPETKFIQETVLRALKSPAPSSDESEIDDLINLL